MYKFLLRIVIASAVFTVKGDFTETIANKTHDQYNTSTEKKCECAVFNTSQPTLEDEPIMMQMTIQVECNDEGETTCSKLCEALALAAHDEAPKLLCATVGNYNNLEVFLYSRVCDCDTWHFTGLSRNNICCSEYEAIGCSEEDLTP
ncbi:hypothetical protein RI129_004251 [Pyrocoelia pectoralis]|uniref:Uncharacterized protein n=1 Tax=Pyrocoelia pectoralis TaxID=417401 RepID=A0AAN7ZKD2_9COLE